jgi:DNA repair exonuclease SbcCD nuclease subunit
MKIAIISDIHLGYERFEEDALSQASEAFEKASTLADAILIPGDVFDKRYPKPEIIAQAINLFRELSKKEWGTKIIDFQGKSRIFSTAPIVAISGTHERIAEGKENALMLLSLAGLLADTSESVTTLQKGQEKVAIFGLGGLSEETVKEKLKQIDPKPIKGVFNIFMFHQSVYEILPFSDHFIHYDDLPKGFDLYVCGHIHSKVEGTVHGKKFLIPGSTVITQLKDQEQEKKGFMIFDTEDNSHKFIPINSRVFISKKINISNAKPTDITRKIEEEINDILSKEKDKPIIKIKIEGKIESGFSNSDMSIRSLLVKYSSKAYLSIDSSQLSNPDVESKIEGLREGKIGDISVKELGLLTFLSKLKEQGINNSIDVNELFNILSGPGSREKILKAANEFLLKSDN